LKFRHLHKFEAFDVADVRITPVPLVHSKPTLGYCIEHEGIRLAYLTDTRELPPASRTFLTEWQPHTICLDCTYPPGTEGKRNHFDLPEAIALSNDYPASNIVLMHISHHLDAWLMAHPDALPERVKLAYDGDILDFSETI
jgi:phosphoribosyl 1,2-cyclic phosphate phosphodiesterase